MLEFLFRCQGVNIIITCDIKEDWAAMKTECATIGAGQQSYGKTIKFEKCDVNDVDGTAMLRQEGWLVNHIVRTIAFQVQRLPAGY